MAPSVIAIAFPVDPEEREKLFREQHTPPEIQPPIYSDGQILPCVKCGMLLNVGPRTLALGAVTLYCPICGKAEAGPDAVVAHLGNPEGAMDRNRYPQTPIEAMQVKLAALSRAGRGPEQHQRQYRHALERGELFWWAGHTAQQVLAASDTYPLDPTAPYLQYAPDKIVRLPNDQMQIAAAGHVVPRLGTSFCVFDAPVLPVPVGVEAQPVSALVIASRFNSLDDPDVPHRHYRFFGLSWNGGGECVPVFAVRWPPSPTEQRDAYDQPDYINTLMRFLLTASQFVDQKILVEGTAALNRAGRKLASRAEVSPVVKTIQLRAREQTTHHAGNSHVEYHCRWIVRGHWRQQPYPKTGDVRPVFIEPYVKGPEDQPLKTPAPDVFVVNR